MTKIALTKGYKALIDDEDFELVSKFKWHVLVTKSGRAYAMSSKNNIPMHRLILNAPAGFDVDHVDGNGLNNTRANIRIATRQQNSYNQRPRTCEWKELPGVKGVTFLDKKWRAQIRADGRNHYLGKFNTIREAAAAYNAKAIELHGEFAKLNDLTKITA